MPYALVPMIDIGPSVRPGRRRTMPLGLDHGGNAVHLGRRRALMWTPQELRDRRAITLCDDGADRMLGRRRRHLQDMLPDRMVGSHLRFAEIAGWALKTPPRQRRNQQLAWGALTPVYRKNQLEVLLGPGGPTATPVLWREDADARGPHSKDVQDTFNRTGNLAGSTTSDAQTTWAEDQGTGWTTVTSAAVFTGTNEFAVARLALAMDTADHYAQADLSAYTRNSNTLAVGVLVRCDATPTSGYGFEIANSAGGAARRFYNFVSDADIAADTTSTTSGLLYLELNGSTYTAKVAGSTVFTGTDSTFNGTVKGVGITGFSTDVTNSASFDSFRGADLGGAQTFSLVVDTAAYSTTGSDVTLLQQVIQTWLRVGR